MFYDWCAEQSLRNASITGYWETKSKISSSRWFASHVPIFQMLPVLKWGSIRVSGKPGSLAQTDSAEGQAALSNGWHIFM